MSAWFAFLPPSLHAFLPSSLYWWYNRVIEILIDYLNDRLSTKFDQNTEAGFWWVVAR